jgi:hypothetical protein
VIINMKTGILGDLTLTFFDRHAVDLKYLAALQARYMNKMVSLVNLEHGPTTLEVIPDHEIHGIKLGQLAICRRAIVNGV